MIRPRPLSRSASERGVARVTACIAACLLYASTAATQNVTEPSLKAAFIFNFAKFTAWPTDTLPPTGSFTACVLGDTSVYRALERTVRDRQVSGHGVIVVQNPLEGPLRTCHVLYVSGVAPNRIATILTAVRGLAVLTISDMDDFAIQGGVAQMFVENGRMRFDLNFDVARRSRLQLSARLLVLGAHVLKAPDAEELP